MIPLKFKASAQTIQQLPGQNDDPATLQDLTIIFSNLLVTIIPLIGLISFIMILVGGITILTSAGNPENLKKGQSTITFAIGGIILAIIAWITLLTIESLTGVKVTQFTFGF